MQVYAFIIGLLGFPLLVVLTNIPLQKKNALNKKKFLFMIYPSPVSNTANIVVWEHPAVSLTMTCYSI